MSDTTRDRRTFLSPHRHIAQQAAGRDHAMRMGAAVPGRNELAFARQIHRGKRHRETADPGVLTALAMQGIGGRWGQTIHGASWSEADK